MSGTRDNTLLDAVAALQPFYDPGDDGYGVELALDAVAGILGEKAGVDVETERGLIQLLVDLGAPKQLQKDVEKLYDHAQGGEYGMGLTKKQAQVVNDLVEHLHDELVEYVSSFGSRPRRRGRKKH